MTMESREICGYPVGRGYISFACTLPPGHPTDEPHMAIEHTPSVVAHQRWEDERRARIEDEARARNEAAQQAADSALGERTDDEPMPPEPVTEHEVRVAMVTEAMVERFNLHYADAQPLASLAVEILDGSRG